MHVRYQILVSFVVRQGIQCGPPSSLPLSGTLDYQVTQGSMGTGGQEDRREQDEVVVPSPSCLVDEQGD